MGLKTAFRKLRGGYPGGWREYAQGYGGDETAAFVQPTDPDDRRSLIPPLGLREYWYPALPAQDVGEKKPVGLRMLGEDLVFFRDRHGEVQALWEYCPHRGAALSWGDCFWKGLVSCPYHGATFDGDGECVEFITEGPDSKMVGRLKARKYPTRTLKGIVYVWMGEGAPAPIEEDVPPELFEDDPAMVVQHAVRYWRCNWMIALENTADAHNAFYVHRDALLYLLGKNGGRPRTPVGYHSKMVNNRATVTMDRNATAYYKKDGKNGELPHQMYYPRAQGYWPLHRWRLLWTWFTDRRAPGGLPNTPEEWAMGMHLPSQQRIATPARVFTAGAWYTRICVPVETNLTRVIYFRAVRLQSPLARAWERLSYRLYYNWLLHFNFSDMDYDAMRSVRYDIPEYLSATDSHLVAQRRLITEHARGLERPIAVAEVTSPEQLVVQAHELLGETREDDYGLVSTGAGEPSREPADAR
jgi:phenylpropionate dioxygenase-like ring-hydroxylating dioxygenase large terminal subunit